MKYISIDLETTGLNPDTCQIIEFAAIIDDCVSLPSSLPSFHCYLPDDYYCGEPYALSMHPTIFRRIATKEKPYQYVPLKRLASEFAKFLDKNGLRQPITAAGKNFASFDLRFLRRVPNWEKMIDIRHRILDPAPFFWIPVLDGERLPNLALCLERAGIHKEVAHNALDDAMDVVHLIRAVLETK